MLDKLGHSYSQRVTELPKERAVLGVLHGAPYALCTGLTSMASTWALQPVQIPVQCWCGQWGVSRAYFAST